MEAVIFPAVIAAFGAFNYTVYMIGVAATKKYNLFARLRGE